MKLNYVHGARVRMTSHRSSSRSSTAVSVFGLLHDGAAQQVARTFLLLFAACQSNDTTNTADIDGSSAPASTLDPDQPVDTSPEALPLELPDVTLPRPQVSGQSVFGSSGGKAIFGDMEIEVPAGALEQDATISAESEISTKAIGEIPDTHRFFGIQLEPAGIYFQEPLRITLRVDPGYESQDLSIVLLPDMETETESDDDSTPQAELLDMVRVDSTHVSFEVSHFSAAVGVAGLLGLRDQSDSASCAGMKYVKDFVSPSLATLCSRGISDQILEIAYADSRNNGYYVPLEGIPNLKFAKGAYEFASKPTRDALALAVGQLPTGAGNIYINTTWRSIVTQAILKKTNSLSTAELGLSRHATANALDIQPPRPSLAALTDFWPDYVDEYNRSQKLPVDITGAQNPSKVVCSKYASTICGCIPGAEGCAGDRTLLSCIVDKTYGNQGAALSASGFTFQPFCANACCDPVHWDTDTPNTRDEYGTTAEQNLVYLRENMVEAYTNLFTANNPCASFNASREVARALDITPVKGYKPNLYNANDKFPETGLPGRGCEQYEDGRSSCCYDPTVRSYSCEKECISDCNPGGTWELDCPETASFEASNLRLVVDEAEFRSGYGVATDEVSGDEITYNSFPSNCTMRLLEEACRPEDYVKQYSVKMADGDVTIPRCYHDLYAFQVKLIDQTCHLKKLSN